MVMQLPEIYKTLGKTVLPVKVQHFVGNNNQ